MVFLSTVNTESKIVNHYRRKHLNYENHKNAEIFENGSFDSIYLILPNWMVILVFIDFCKFPSAISILLFKVVFCYFSNS